MKKFLILSFLFSYSCSVNKSIQRVKFPVMLKECREFPFFDQSILISWRVDSLGLDGKRSPLLNQLGSVEKIIGFSDSCIISNLGSPSEVINGNIFIYNVSAVKNEKPPTSWINIYFDSSHHVIEAMYGIQ